MTFDNETPEMYTRDYETPTYTTLAEVQRAGRRRRSRTRITVASLAVVGVGLGGFLAGQLLETGAVSAPTARQMDSASADSLQAVGPVRPGRPFIIPVQSGGAAPAGSLAYRDCEDECRLWLRAPKSEPVDLGRSIPELQPAIGSGFDIDKATLSFDAQWLGIPAGQGYLVASMRVGGAVVRVPNAPGGQRWTPIGWTPSSGSLALARTDGEEVTGFAIVDTFDVTGRQARVNTLERNPLPGWVPAYNGGDSVIVSKRARPGEATTGWVTQKIFVSSDQFEPGEQLPAQNQRMDFSACLGANEALVSASGWVVVSTPPAPDAPDASEGAYTTSVLAFDSQSHKPTAILVSGCSRREITGDAAFNPQPRTTDSTLTRVVGDRSTLIRLDGPGDVEKVVFEHEQLVEVILPGQSAAG